MNAVLYLAGKLSPKAYYRLTQLRYKIPLIGTLLSGAGDFIRNRDGIIPRGLGKGLKFNVGDSIAGYLLGTQEPHVQAAIGHLVHSGMVTYDLGANVGFISLLLARAVGSKGQVISFEPVTANAERIAYNARINNFSNVVVRIEAVGMSDGRAAFTIGDFPTIGKLENEKTSDQATRDVPIRSLDSLIQREEIPPPDFVKIDIEGAEIECLRGATALLKLKRPLLLIELHATNKAVQAVLSDASYESLVLGSKQTILEGHWNVQIVGFPSERPLPPDVHSSLTDTQFWR